MRFCIGSVFVAVLTAAVFPECASNHLTTPIQNLPPELLSEIVSILVNGTVHMVGNCSEDVGVELTYWLYTEKTPTTPTNINSFDLINRDNPIMILIHGYLGHRDADHIQTIKNAYVQKMPSNVIVVDWEKYANGLYTTAFCNVTTVATNIVEFIIRLVTATAVPLRKLHIVGHSLGAQVAGEVGKQFDRRVGRITGLDPAGPLYQNVPREDRLDAGDANYVDVIHTNQGQFGYKGNAGHINFYPNCGYLQPGCPRIPTPIKELIKLPLSIIACSHLRSSLLFAESIEKNDFPAVKCRGCGEGPRCGSLPDFDKPRMHMGQYSRTYAQRHRDYFVATKDKYPFGMNLTAAQPQIDFNAILKEPDSGETSAKNV